MKKRTVPLKRANRRAQLLTIARQLVFKEGIGALTMMALSERGNVAKPVVYTHFQNREAVAIALLNDHFEALSKFVREQLAGADTLEAYFSRLIDASFDYEGHSDLPVRKITNGFSAGDDVNQAFLWHEETFQKQWEELLALLGVRKEYVEVAAYSLHNMVNNTVYTYSISRQSKSARRALKAMLLAAISSMAPAARKRIPPEALEKLRTKIIARPQISQLRKRGRAVKKRVGRPADRLSDD